MLVIAILDIFYICMRKRTHQATTGGSLELGLYLPFKLSFMSELSSQEDSQTKTFHL